MDKFLRNALAASALLAGIGVFYHFVIYLPGLERTKQEAAAEDRRAKQEEAAARQSQAELEKRDAELKESARQAIYEACVREADETYDTNWTRACQNAAKQAQAGYQRCMATSLGEAFCKASYSTAPAVPSCSLPKTMADSVNSYYLEAKQTCLTEAKAGLAR